MLDMMKFVFFDWWFVVCGWRWLVLVICGSGEKGGGADGLEV
jgi:hypothetical protein